MARRGIEIARKLRRNRSKSEQQLWQWLRGRRFCKLKFRRQFPVEGYICDFVCLECRIVVEVDGEQHDQAVAADQVRTAALEAAGFVVLRFWNSEIIHRIEYVLDVIARTAAAAKNAPIA